VSCARYNPVMRLLIATLFALATLLSQSASHAEREFGMRMGVNFAVYAMTH
jgi:hypothetical protein